MSAAQRENSFHPINRRLNRESHSAVTEFIQLNMSECRACFKCVDVCPEDVFGKINIIIHRHAVIRKKDRCIGCGKCMNICDTGAISRIMK